MANFAPVTIVLDKKDPGAGHVVVGADHPLHVLFLQEVLGGAEVLGVAKLTDEMVLNRLALPGSFIFLIAHERGLALSADTRTMVRVWAAAPIKKDSAAIGALVRYAGGLLGMEEVDKATLRLVGAKVIQQCREDGSPWGMIWAATWVLTDKDPVEDAWKHPWETSWGWASHPPMAARLHILYRDLAAWVFARDDDRKGAEAIGVSPSRFQWLKGVRLAPRCVDAALVILSAWRTRPDDGYTTALKIGAVFEKF